MTDDEAWQAEEQFWTGGEAHFRSMIDPGCVMAFPAPAGIITGSAIIDSLRNAPRWSSVAFGDTHVARPSPDLLVLAYRARANRSGNDPYEAYCTSTYRLSDDRFRLVQHQQTPI